MHFISSIVQLKYEMCMQIDMVMHASYIHICVIQIEYANWNCTDIDITFYKWKNPTAAQSRTARCVLIHSLQLTLFSEIEISVYVRLLHHKWPYTF